MTRETGSRFRKISAALVWRSGAALLMALAWLVIPGESMRSPGDWTAAAREANAFATRLLRDHPEALDEATRNALAAALKVYDHAAQLTWRTAAQHTALTPEQVRERLAAAERGYEAAARQIAAALRRVPAAIPAKSPSRLSPRSCCSAAARIVMPHRLSFGNAWTRPVWNSRPAPAAFTRWSSPVRARPAARFKSGSAARQRPAS